MPFTFDKNYKNLEQVAEFLPAFNEVYEAERAAGRYTYNDSFKGRVAGIEGECEDAAIYLLQHLRRQRECDEKVARYLADGFEPIESVDGVQKFARVVLYDDLHGGMNGGRWLEFASARLVPETNPNQIEATGPIRGVLPRGKRTNGVSAMGQKVMVLR